MLDTDDYIEFVEACIILPDLCCCYVGGDATTFKWDCPTVYCSLAVCLQSWKRDAFDKIGKEIIHTLFFRDGSYTLCD